MSYNPSMCFNPAGIDACALWRMFMPHINIPNSSFQFTQGIPPINQLAENDAIVVQRLMTENNIEFLRQAREFGLRIIYDLDDNLWNLPAANPAYAIFRQKQYLDGIDACIEWADVVTVSTKELKRVVEYRYGGTKNIASGLPIKIMHIDNAVDLNLFQPISKLTKDEDKIILGWGGSNTHNADLAHFWRIIPDLLSKYPNLFVEFAGSAPPRNLAIHDRVSVRPWVHVSEYHARFATWNWDIVVAPLEEHKFNKSKSCIKMIEAGVISKPCLAQDIAPYEYFASFDKDLKWLLCSDSQWHRKLEALIEDRALREDLGDAMRENVEENFNITRTVSQWEEACFSSLFQ